MRDRVDLDRLGEAVEWLDSQYDKTGMWPRQMTDPIVNGSRAVLSAPTVQWCTVHGETYNGKDDGLDQCWAAEVYLDLPLEDDCKLTAVALVPLEADE